MVTTEGDWRQDGFVIVRGLWAAERVEKLKEIADFCWGQWVTCSPEDGKANGANGTCMRHLNHPGYFPPGSEQFVELMEAIADQNILRLVQQNFERPPLFRSTSLFQLTLSHISKNPDSGATDGAWHRDTQFLIPDEDHERAYVEESVANGVAHCKGVQMQIALVPNDDVELVRGSHLRWDTPAEYAVRCADGRTHSTEEMPGAVRVQLAAGDAVLFNSNGFHRGRYHADKPRTTLMFTYTGLDFPTFDYFSNQPWFLQPDYLAALSPGARAFFGRFLDKFGGQIASHAAAGESLKDARAGGSQSYTPYLQQAREHMEAIGVDPGVLARL